MNKTLLAIPVRTRRHFNVGTTSSQRYGRCIDALTTLCVCRDLKNRSNRQKVSRIRIFKEFEREAQNNLLQI